MESKIYIVVNNSIEFPCMDKKFNQQKGSELFPLSGSLEFVAIDILGPLRKSKAGS